MHLCMLSITTLSIAFDIQRRLRNIKLQRKSHTMLGSRIQQKALPTTSNSRAASTSGFKARILRYCFIFTHNLHFKFIQYKYTTQIAWKFKVNMICFKKNPSPISSDRAYMYVGHLEASRNPFIKVTLVVNHLP